MNEERLYDYSKGLNAPYWIQEIKTKGHSTMVLCDTYAVVLFHCLYHRFCGHVTLWRVYLCATRKITHSISLLLYWYLPYKLAKFYTEYEPHGKKMHVFIGDYLIYFWDFKLNKKLSTTKIE